MSAKFVYSLSDEKNLQKQIGCMNGFFQFFDRHHFVGGGRRFVGQSHHNRLPSGKSGKQDVELKGAEKKTENNYRTNIKEKHRGSTETSRNSFSSSCSSSLSSADCSKASHQESFGLTNICESNVKDLPKNRLNGSLPSNRQSPDLRNTVKDSIYREVRSVAVKTTTKGEAGAQTLKYIDSPRPMQLVKSATPVYPGKPIDVLQKLQEVRSKSNEDRFARRLSYDERDLRDAVKSNMKLKEFPRLSLDSKVAPIRNSTTERQSTNYIGEVAVRRNGIGRVNHLLKQQEEPGSNRRPSSVVVKLMGLEALPDPISTDMIHTAHVRSNIDEDNDSFMSSYEKLNEIPQWRVRGSSTNCHREPISPRMRSAGSVRKLANSSKFPIESAPWKQLEPIRSSETPEVQSPGPTKAANSSLSVFGEMEKRLAQLEFSKSGKDLRALKQILEAMQRTKERIETRVDHGIRTSNKGGLNQSQYLSVPLHLESDSLVDIRSKEAYSPKSISSSVAIKKAAKLPGRRDSVGIGITKDQSFRVDHLKDTLNLTPRPVTRNMGPRVVTPTQTRQSTIIVSKDSTNSGTRNPTTQQKKSELAKQFGPPMPVTKSIRSRRQLNKLVTESHSRIGQSRTKTPNLQGSNAALATRKSQMRSKNQEGDTVSLVSECSSSLASQCGEDDEVSSIFIHHTHPIRKNLNKYGQTDETVVASSEQPSPVSVLDATFYSDDLPSPIKKIYLPFKDDDPQESDEAEWNTEEMYDSCCSTKPGFNCMIGREEGQSIQPLINNLKLVISLDDESTTNVTASFYNSKNPNHVFISEILAASGLLKVCGTTKTIHQHDYPINPDSFIALERVVTTMKQSSNEQKHLKLACSVSQINVERKLIFDVVSEILVSKLILENYPTQSLSLTNIRTGHQLLEELCSAVDKLQVNNWSSDDEEDSLESIIMYDLMHQPEQWTECSEIPSLVLDIERLIFKDLISEVVNGESSFLQRLPTGHCRQVLSRKYC